LNLGFGEIITILIILLVLFGPDKLPDIARKLGKYYRQLMEYKHFLDEEFRRGFLEGLEEESVNNSDQANIKRPKPSKDLIRLARELNIDPEGKTSDELINEIKEIVGRKAESDE